MIRAKQTQMTRTIQHPAFPGRKIEAPPNGKLKWFGGNMGLDSPIHEDVIDSTGNWLSMGLAEVLDRLEDFVGYVGNVPIKSRLIDAAFSAYEYSLMTSSEKLVFERFIKDKIGGMTSIEAARKLMGST